jgi:acyl-CoA thioesterase-2
MPQVTPPEELPNEAEIKATILPNMPEAVQRYYKSERPIELRPVEYGRYLGQKSESGKFNVWIRATGKLPDDPAIHQCVLAYASDLSLLNTALVPHGRSLFEKEFMGASLDHALWLHRPFRADDWLLYAQESPIMTGSRGFARGLIFRRDGDWSRASRRRDWCGSGGRKGECLLRRRPAVMLSATASAIRMPSTPADKIPPA